MFAAARLIAPAARSAVSISKFIEFFPGLYAHILAFSAMGLHNNFTVLGFLNSQPTYLELLLPCPY